MTPADATDLPDTADRPDAPNHADELLEALEARGLTLAVAESLTGGLVASSLVGVPGASRVLRGAVVAYATDLKASLLGVERELLAARGPIDPRVAEQMAAGAAERLGADMGIATTGVAGPDAQDGHPPGTVHVAAALGRLSRSSSLVIPGDRAHVRSGARDAVIDLALAVLADSAR